MFKILFDQLMAMVLVQGMLAVLCGVFLGAAIGVLYFFEEKWTARIGCVICALTSFFFLCLVARYVPHGQINTFVIVYGIPLILVHTLLALIDLLLIEKTAKVTFTAMQYSSRD